jgi:hypothetical protein
MDEAAESVTDGQGNLKLLMLTSKGTVFIFSGRHYKIQRVLKLCVDQADLGSSIKKAKLLKVWKKAGSQSYSYVIALQQSQEAKLLFY